MATAQAARPNILLITTDEHALESIGCHGARAVATPNIDRLAREGVRFARACTISPLCMPARTALATGMSPARSGCICNRLQSWMRDGWPNLFRGLKAAGYATALAGKCHFVPVRYGEARPGATQPYERERAYYLGLGIDRLFLQDDKQVSVWFLDDYARDLREAGWLEAYRAAVWDRTAAKTFAFPGPGEWHPDSWVGRKAAEAIASHAGDGPLFLWASFSGPHYPFDPPESYLARVDEAQLDLGRRREGEWDDASKIHFASYHGGPGASIDGCAPAPGRACRNYSEDYWRRLRRHYFANVAQIDDEIGRIVAAAERRFGRNLLVVFTADHGEMLGNHALWGKNLCGYDEVMRIPLIARMPGVFESGESEAFVSQLDLAPTFLDLAGAAPLPAQDGRDLRRAMDGGGPDCAVCFQRHFMAATDGRIKYIRCIRDGKPMAEIYDLERDPGEFENRAADPRLKADAARLMEALLDPLAPDYRPGARNFV